MLSITFPMTFKLHLNGKRCLKCSPQIHYFDFFYDREKWLNIVFRFSSRSDRGASAYRRTIESVG